MANVARFALRFLQGFTATHEVECIVTFHTRRADIDPPYDTPDLAALCEQIVYWWENGDRSYGAGDAELNGVRIDYSDETRLFSIDAYRLLPTIGPVLTYDTGLPLPGTQADGPGPPQASVLISWLTDDADRRGRGRTYMPAPRSGMYDPDGRIVNCLSTLLVEPGWSGVARWGRILYRNIADSAGTTPDDRLCVFSRADGVARTMTGVRAPDYLATQRRRRREPVEYALLDFAALPD